MKKVMVTKKHEIAKGCVHKKRDYCALGKTLDSCETDGSVCGDYTVQKLKTIVIKISPTLYEKAIKEKGNKTWVQVIEGLVGISDRITELEKRVDEKMVVEIKKEFMAEYKKMFREALLKTECPECGGPLTHGDVLHPPRRGKLIKSGPNKGQEGWVFEYCCPHCKKEPGWVAGKVVEKTYFDLP